MERRAISTGGQIPAQETKLNLKRDPRSSHPHSGPHPAKPGVPGFNPAEVFRSWEFGLHGLLGLRVSNDENDATCNIVPSASYLCIFLFHGLAG